MKSKVFEIESTGSTQDEVRARLNETPGEAAAVWVRALRQSAGRGRQGRGWISREGDLLVSCGIKYPAPVTRKSFVTLIAGLALFKAVGIFGSPPESIFLKWPNDFFWRASDGSFRKIAGVLAESHNADHVVVGWGVNISGDREPLSASAYQPAGLAEIFENPAAATLLLALEKEFGGLIETWGLDPAGFERQVVGELRNHAMKPLWGTEGRLSATSFRAEAIDLDDNGALVVRLKEGPERDSLKSVVSGEFSFFPRT